MILEVTESLDATKHNPEKEELIKKWWERHREQYIQEIMQDLSHVKDLQIHDNIEIDLAASFESPEPSRPVVRLTIDIIL